MEKIWKVGIVGVGNIAQGVYIPQMSQIPNAKITALCDLNGAKAKAVAEQYGIPEYYDNINEFIEKSDTEIVMSVASIQGRQELNLKLIRAGKHVFTQKPFAPTVEEATEQIEEAKKYGVKLSVGPIHREKPDRQLVRQLIDEGMIGHVSLMKIDASHGGPEYYQFRDSDPAWFYQEGAGALPDLAVHAIDQMVAMLGPAKYVSCIATCSEPRRIVRSGAFDGVEIKSDILPDNYIISLDFGNGTIGVATCGFVQKASANNVGYGFEIFGSEGSIFLGDPTDGSGIGKVKLYVDKPGQGLRGWIEPMPLKKAPQKVYFDTLCIPNLIDAIENDHEPILSAEHARHVVEILSAIPVSVAEGRKVELKTTF